MFPFKRSATNQIIESLKELHDFLIFNKQNILAGKPIMTKPLLATVKPKPKKGSSSWFSAFSSSEEEGLGLPKISKKDSVVAFLDRIEKELKGSLAELQKSAQWAEELIKKGNALIKTLEASFEKLLNNIKTTIMPLLEKQQ